jgi:histidinol-phosphate aminotransferase
MGKLEDNFFDIEPYVPGEQVSDSGIIKLNTNENAYGPGLIAKEAIADFGGDLLRKYPSVSASALRKALAGDDFPEAMVFAGNGSDEVLAFAFRAFFSSGRPILFPDVTYSFYPVWCNFFGIPYETVPLGSDFRINSEDYTGRTDIGGIVIANPNAPTGAAEGTDFIEKIAAANPDIVVIVDEAYVAFGAETSAELTKKYKNLLVTQSFSKSRALAGLRIGFAIGDEALIAKLDAVKNSFNSYTIGSLTEHIAVAAKRDEKHHQDIVDRIISTRERLATELKKLGFEMPESKANFVFATHPSINATDLAAYLRSKNILVRHFPAERTKNHLRISIGTEAETDALLAAIKAYLSTPLCHCGPRAAISNEHKQE